jgi:hypothetical protein
MFRVRRMRAHRVAFLALTSEPARRGVDLHTRVPWLLVERGEPGGRMPDAERQTTVTRGRVAQCHRAGPVSPTRCTSCVGAAAGLDHTIRSESVPDFRREGRTPCGIGA